MTEQISPITPAAAAAAAAREIERAGKHFRITRGQMAEALDDGVLLDYVLLKNALVAQARHMIWADVAEMSKGRDGDLVAAMREVRAKQLRNVLAGHDNVASGLADGLSRVRDQARRDFLRFTDRLVT
ncbi:hypothetical protein AB0F17_34200 [Nonomuraea sp. NPDC026600]|uniref:hypothetical protein n=1 Tax=Nonomuraea sp. NPDC026600 TaxID=3155363 RepID=UPI0033C6E5B8